MIYIGIDPGTNTGLAIWSSSESMLLEVKTVTITQAMAEVQEYKAAGGAGNLMVVFEDARQRKWFGERSQAKMQGAGSIKRDCSIWEDFLRERGISFRAVPPVKGGTKLTAERFRRLTGWKGQTNEHGRDAAMLVFGK
ncbi:MAG: hypothetical protein NC115_12090 [Bacteroidales bacterium]|nr:hypothetical protein [Bacteroidales bacterium]